MMEKLNDNPLVLFDGVCNLCNASVQTLIRLDPAGLLRFAALQSAIGQEILRQTQRPTQTYDSVLLYHRGRLYSHSTAALEICRLLGWPWKALLVFRAVPRPWRDAVYNWVARNRYRWFGQQESCMMPSPELRQRFIE